MKPGCYPVTGQKRRLGTGGATSYWLGEDDEITASDIDADLISLSPKTIAALAEVTRKMLVQGTPDAEMLIRNDIARSLALGIDLAGFYGSGSANQPLGINGAGINSVTFSAALPTYVETVAMESAIAADNADVSSMAYVMGSAMRGHYKTTEKFATSNGAPIWEPGNMVNGYRSEVTNQIVAGDVFFGNFMDLLVGMWGGLDLTVDPYTHSARGRVRITAFQDVDFAVRHPESFCVGRD